jgi:glycosyltransferase involved in cell wall biosynthesis
LFDNGNWKAGERVRIGILWTGLSGYLNACLQELASREGVQLFVSHKAPALDAPFDESQFTWIQNRFMWRAGSELDGLEARLREFNPEVLIFAGWAVPAYRHLSKALAGKCLRIMTMDNCWLGTPKQRLATWIAPFYLRPLADAVWLPGERQAVFARKLGFEQRAILRGLYCCDQPRLEAIHADRLLTGSPVPHAFLFVGRFVQDKGIDTLVKAYESYRAKSSNPWPLICCGAGPLRSLLENKSGIQIEGFLQPEQLRSRFGHAGCLVLPSDFEPWAVVVHEAASAGLLILASENVGAAVHLVQDNYNGYIFGGKDAPGLAALMGRVSAMTDERLDEMSRASRTLSLQFSPGRWADTLLDVAGQWAGGAEVVSSRSPANKTRQAVHVKFPV